MSRTVTSTVYQFDELEDKAKEKARDWFRNGDTDFDTEFLFDDFERMGAMLGIEFKQQQVKLMGGGTRGKPTIYFSGFSSQGDGACFEGSYYFATNAVAKITEETSGNDKRLIRIAEELEEVQALNANSLAATVRHSGHYSHEYSTDIEVERTDDSDSEVSDEHAEAVRTCLRDFMRWMYRALEEDYEWRNADEQVDDNIRANEYEFTESGHIA